MAEDDVLENGAGDTEEERYFLVHLRAFCGDCVPLIVRAEILLGESSDLLIVVSDVCLCEQALERFHRKPTPLLHGYLKVPRHGHSLTINVPEP